MKRGVIFTLFLALLPTVVFAVPLPSSVHLSIPFTSQAPYANWDDVHEEACEEAAALMVHRFWQKKPFTGKQDAEAAIQDLVKFQIKKYGFYKDTTAAETARFIKARWGYKKVDLIVNPTAAQIRREVANGYPVLVPTYGRNLGNPNFKRPGPIYHMLVVKGYDANGTFITNDAGTRKGADYRYASSVLMNAMHDWNGGDVQHGRKVIIIVRGK